MLRPTRLQSFKGIGRKSTEKPIDLLLTLFLEF